VEDPVGKYEADCLCDRLLVGHVAVDPVDAVLDVGDVVHRRQVVTTETEHLDASLEEEVRQVRPHKTRDTRYQDPVR